MGPVPLEAGDEGMVGRIAEIAVLPGGVQHGMDPFQGLVNQHFVIQDIGQGQQAVDPVGAPLPSVAVPTEPGVVVPDDRRIQAVEMACQPVPLPFQLVQQPSLRPHGAKRQFRILRRRERCPVENRFLGAKGDAQR